MYRLIVDEDKVIEHDEPGYLIGQLIGRVMAHGKISIAVIELVSNE